MQPEMALESWSAPPVSQENDWAFASMLPSGMMSDAPLTAPTSNAVFREDFFFLSDTNNPKSKAAMPRIYPDLEPQLFETTQGIQWCGTTITIN